MTLKTSLFNKGIYKSTVRRYLWGAVLYFIILFVSTALPILLAYDPHTAFGSPRPVLYQGGYALLSVVIAMFVPTVVGLLVFRFIHSKKTSIFIHSLPVGRKGIFVSSVLAGLTLMFAPVILNGIILAIMSFTDYGIFVSLSSAICWTILNLLALFTMFACTTFVAVLTGNSFAMVALTALFHGIIPLLCGIFGVFAETFLFGFTDITELLTKVAQGNLVYRLINHASGLYTYYKHGIPLFGLGTLWEIIAAVALFAPALILYKKRNLENAEDVAGFKVLNPVFKYLVTFLGAMCAFALFSSFISEKPAVFALIVFIVSVVTYFAAEMVLKKTLKVWKSYKGYIAFAAVFLVMTSIFAFTSFFGYEMRVPSPDEVESVAVYQFYNYDEPYTGSDEVKDCAINIHKELIAKDKIYTVRPAMTYQIRLQVKYKLKNGREIARAYWMSEKEKFEIMGKLYRFDDYRTKLEGVANQNPEDVYRVNVYSNNGEEFVLSDREKIKSLHEAVSKDLMSLDYNEIYTDFGTVHINFEISNPEGLGPHEGNATYYPEGAKISYADVSINSNFKNTNNWLKDNGYPGFSYYSGLKGTVYFALTEALEQINYNYPELTGAAKMLKEAELNGQPCVYLSEDAKVRLNEFVTANYLPYIPGENKYQVLCSREEGGYDGWGTFGQEEMKEILAYIFK